MSTEEFCTNSLIFLNEHINNSVLKKNLIETIKYCSPQHRKIAIHLLDVITAWLIKNKRELQINEEKKPLVKNEETKKFF